MLKQYIVHLDYEFYCIFLKKKKFKITVFLALKNSIGKVQCFPE